MSETTLPNTRRDVEVLTSEVERILAKPDLTDGDRAFLREATAAIEAVSGQSGVAPSAGAVEAGFQPEAIQPGQAAVPNQGTNVPISAQQQVANQVISMKARHRSQDLANVFQRPFMSEQEQIETATRQRVERAKEQLDLESTAQASGVDLDSIQQQIAGVAGQIAPDVALSAVPGAIGFRTGAGAAGRVAAETAVGGVSGAANVPLGEDITEEAQFGAVLGLGGGAISEAPGLALDFLRRDLRAARNSDVEARMAKVSEETGIDLTLSERTQSPAAFQAETAVPGRPANLDDPKKTPRSTFINKRKEQVDAALQKAVDTLNPAEVPTEQIIRSTKEAFETHVGARSKLASAEFQATMDDPLAAIGARFDDEGRIVGGFNFFEPTELLDELRTQRALLANQPLAGKNKTALKALDDEIAALDGSAAGTPPRQLNMGQVQRLLKDLSAANAPTGIVIKDNTQAVDILSTAAVQRALTRDIDRHAQLPNQFGEATGALQDARKTFGQERAQIEALKGRAFEKLLGGANGVEADDFANKVLNMNARSFDEMMDIADEVDPNLGRNIRAVVFDELLDKHRKFDVTRSAAGAPQTAVNVPDLVSQLNKMPERKLRSFLDAGNVLDTKQLNNLTLALKAISEGSTTAATQGTRSIRQQMEQYAINAASRDQGFIARLLAGELTPGAMERLLFTPEGQRALSALGTPKVGRAVVSQAANIVIAAMSEDDEQTAETDRQRRARANEQLLRSNPALRER